MKEYELPSEKKRKLAIKKVVSELNLYGGKMLAASEEEVPPYIRPLVGRIIYWDVAGSLLAMDWEVVVKKLDRGGKYLVDQSKVDRYPGIEAVLMNLNYNRKEATKNAARY